MLLKSLLACYMNQAVSFFVLIVICHVSKLKNTQTHTTFTMTLLYVKVYFLVLCFVLIYFKNYFLWLLFLSGLSKNIMSKL